MMVMIVMQNAERLNLTSKFLYIVVPKFIYIFNFNIYYVHELTEKNIIKIITRKS